MLSNTKNNFSKLDVGEFENTQNAEFHSDILGTVKGKHFLKDSLGLTSMEVSLNCFPVGKSMSFYHKHSENEELYYFLKGQGQFQVDDETFNVKEGTLVRVAPSGVRIWRNTGKENLYYLVIQARENSMNDGTISDGAAVQKDIVWPEEINV